MILSIETGAQSIVFEDFSQGQWNSTSWFGDSSNFQIINQQLVLKDSLAASSCLYHPSAAMASARWEYHGKLDFNPSSSNYLEISLAFDHPNPDSVYFSYYIRIGGNSQDQLRFYRQDLNDQVLLLSSNSDLLDRDPLNFHLLVLRDSLHRWSVFADTGAFNQWQALGTIVDSNHRFSIASGFSCNYTKTRSSHFYLDSLRISGRPVADVQAPKLIDLLLDSNRLKMTFNEKLAAPATNAQFSSEPPIALQGFSWHRSNPKELSLLLDSLPKANQAYKLYLSGLYDLFGNDFSDSLNLLRRVVETGDIRINELMPDPSPKVDPNPNSFPEVEYLELVNTSALAIELLGFKIRVGNREYPLPKTTVEPEEFIILSAANSLALWPSAIKVLPLDWSSSALNNSSAAIALISPEGLVIDELIYSDSWYNEPNKAEGGWSLERVDANSNCANEKNWAPSQDPSGGSPGRQNSIAGDYHDSIMPQLLYYELPSVRSLALHFDRSLNVLAQNLQVWENLQIDSIVLANEAKLWTLYFNSDMQVGDLYQLSLEEPIFDCNGAALIMDTIIFGLALKPEQGDIRISEILFNPFPDGSDFVELKNLSANFIDLADLSLGIWNQENDLLTNVAPISFQHRILAPGAVVALTEDIVALKRDYSLALNSVHEVDELPSLADQGVALALIRNDFEILDRIVVEDDFHFPLLRDQEGVSLYRLDFSQNAVNSAQWQSTARIHNFATPGWEVTLNENHSSSNWFPDPEYLSPNNDGYNDLIRLNYNLASSAWVQVYIYDRYGNLVKDICHGEQVPERGNFIWKGLNNANELCPRGVYIAVLSYLNPNGKNGYYRCSFVLSQ